MDPLTSDAAMTFGTDVPGARIRVGGRSTVVDRDSINKAALHCSARPQPWQWHSEAFGAEAFGAVLPKGRGTQHAHALGTGAPRRHRGACARVSRDGTGKVHVHSSSPPLRQHSARSRSGSRHSDVLLTPPGGNPSSGKAYESWCQGNGHGSAGDTKQQGARGMCPGYG